MRSMVLAHTRSAEEAGAFVRKLQGLLRRVGSGDGDMEKVGAAAKRICMLAALIAG